MASFLGVSQEGVVIILLVDLRMAARKRLGGGRCPARTIEDIFGLPSQARRASHTAPWS
jgi:hypothetical protein